jgi:hypothetical protein
METSSAVQSLWQATLEMSQHKGEQPIFSLSIALGPSRSWKNHPKKKYKKEEGKKETR